MVCNLCSVLYYPWKRWKVHVWTKLLYWNIIKVLKEFFFTAALLGRDQFFLQRARYSGYNENIKIVCLWPVRERKNTKCWTGTVNHHLWQEQSLLFLLLCLDCYQGLWWILQSSSQSPSEHWSIYMHSGVQLVWSHLLVVLFVWFIFFLWIRFFLYLEWIIKNV